MKKVISASRSPVSMSGQSVALKMATAGSPLSLCQVSSRDNDSWPKAFPLDSLRADRERLHRFAGQGPLVQDQRHAGSAHPGGALRSSGRLRPRGVQGHRPGVSRTSSIPPRPARAISSSSPPNTRRPPSARRRSARRRSARTRTRRRRSRRRRSAHPYSRHRRSARRRSAHRRSRRPTSARRRSRRPPSVRLRSAAFTPSVYTARRRSSRRSRRPRPRASSPSPRRPAPAANRRSSTRGTTPGTSTSGSPAATAPSVRARSSRSPSRKGRRPATCVTDVTLTPRTPVGASGLKTVILTDSSKVALDSELLVPGGGRCARSSPRSPGAPKSRAWSSTSPATRGWARSRSRRRPTPPVRSRRTSSPRRSRASSTRYRANPLQYVVIVGNDARDSVLPLLRTRACSGRNPAYVPPVAERLRVRGEPAPGLRAEPGCATAPRRRISLRVDRFSGAGARGRAARSKRTTEIAGMIDAYVAANGVVVPRHVARDRLRLPARTRRTRVRHGARRSGTGAVARRHADHAERRVAAGSASSWTATQLGAALLGSRHDVIFLAGHFSANSALAADFSTNLLTTDLAASSMDLHQLDRVQRRLPLRLQHRRRRRDPRRDAARSTGRRRSRGRRRR